MLGLLGFLMALQVRPQFIGVLFLLYVFANLRTEFLILAPILRRWCTAFFGDELELLHIVISSKERLFYE